MPERPIRYETSDADSARWCELAPRAGDIVISTRSKSGTTWMQMICALLVFQSPELPAPLGEISPWLDWLVEPIDAVVARLEAQDHRRIIKTHTPLYGLPLVNDTTYIVVARHPLDMAVSLYHQRDNLDRRQLARLTGTAPSPASLVPLEPLSEWLWSWVTWEGDSSRNLDTLPGVVRHVRDAWQRRPADNVVLVHYDELSRDLEGTMRFLAARLGLTVDEDRWAALVQAATFDAMRQQARTVVPDTLGVLKDPARFFRGGRSGDGAAMLTADQLDQYHLRVASLVDAELLAWLHGAA